MFYFCSQGLNDFAKSFFKRSLLLFSQENLVVDAVDVVDVVVVAAVVVVAFIVFLAKCV